MCLPWRAMRKPAFSSARTARRWLTPGILGTACLYGDLDLTDYHASGTSRLPLPCTRGRASDDVGQGFLFRRPLGRTTRKAWNPDGESLFGLFKRYPAFHRPPPGSSRSKAVNERFNLALSGVGRAVHPLIRQPEATRRSRPGGPCTATSSANVGIGFRAPRPTSPAFVTVRPQTAGALLVRDGRVATSVPVAPNRNQPMPPRYSKPPATPTNSESPSREPGLRSGAAFSSRRR